MPNNDEQFEQWYLNDKMKLFMAGWGLRELCFCMSFVRRTKSDTEFLRPCWICASASEEDIRQHLRKVFWEDGDLLLKTWLWKVSRWTAVGWHCRKWFRKDRELLLSVLGMAWNAHYSMALRKTDPSMFPLGARNPAIWEQAINLWEKWEGENTGLNNRLIRAIWAHADEAAHPQDEVEGSIL